ncbi:hypothetical protein Rctr85_005 [Virus Rctr85]|nr:hypothetical protein Rctr85_005 [Virus Rctr85]
MVKRSRLADLVGLGDIEDTLRQSILDAADEVADRFRQVLVQLQNDSESGAFVGYEVVIDTEPYTVTKRNLGNLSLVRCHIYVQSPDPDLNLFDLLDAGRPDLPERPPGESPYPLWNLRDPRLVHRPGERRSRREAGRFSRSRPPSSFRGLRPETLRYRLVGKMPKDAQYSPALFTRGPIKAVPPTKLYARILREAKKISPPAWIA